MRFFRPADPEAEARAVRQLNRFRSILILTYLLGWVLFTAWIWSSRPEVPGLDTSLHLVARVVLPAVALILVPLLHLFSIAVAGLLFRLRLPVWLVCVATCLLGPLLAIAFVTAALGLMA